MRYLIIIILFITCNNNDKYLPPSTGSESEILFVVSDSLWSRDVNELASNVFEKFIVGLNQNEQEFNLIQINNDEFNSILRRHKNIVIINERVVNNNFKQDQWANNQNIFYVNWQQDFSKNKITLNNIKNRFAQIEIAKLKNSYLLESNNETEKKLKNRFGVEFVIPSKYKVNETQDAFFWASYNPSNSDEIKQILIFSFKPKTTNITFEVLSKLDSVYSTYLNGSKKNSYVTIEPNYPPHYSNNIYRGLWRLENGFMGGPFIAKTYFVNDTIIISTGVVFAPQSTKRKHIKEFEAIL